MGGIALHADGGLVLSGRSVVHVRDGATRTLLEVDGVPGWNDLGTDPAGRVYVGSIRFQYFAGEAPRPSELWRIAAESEAEILYEGVLHPNGVRVSPDGRRLYHSDTARAVVIVHDLTPDGRAVKRREFPTSAPARPDGIAMDEDGCPWVALPGAGCVARFTPDGVLDLRIDVPARDPTSLCFGGADRRDLYIVSADNAEDPARGGSIFRTRSPVPGMPVPAARV